MTPRAVITGLGVVAPTGIGVADHWSATLAGKCCITPFTRYPDTSPIQLAGQVEGFDERAHVSNKLIVQTDRFTWFALAATTMAFTDAGLDPASMDPYAVSVVTAAASGGNEFGQREIQSLWAQGSETVTAYQSIAWFYAASSGQISILHKLRGSCGVLVADTAGGLDVFGQARRVITRGGQAVVVGGTEAPLTPYALVCQADLQAMSTAGDAGDGYRPFDAAAGGYLPGEGGAMVVVESLDSARDRGAEPYAEVLGHAATHDAHHHTEPDPGGRQLARAMATAISRAGLAPHDIDVVFADAAGARGADGIEVAALRQVFGDAAGGIPVTAPKSMVGRLYSGGGPLDVSWAALALRHGVIPPTVNLDPASAGYGLTFVTEPVRPERLRHALVVARGVGGFNSALVLGAVG
ncbi:actinorhodin polyketide beta-ketoacyl synthase [Actinoplanes sp. NBRC 14428]|uniref:Minimal PKS chain-length factor (CLF/KS beta) n=1 Tax=Pseudosporangium ferrugineum TaxID=439699 RepID=A0A2T0RX62_9ACTN|nr:beta-ketoacyl synthase N-terminal-like domain-containing protein [Pseudosporangium ferrugineum]PRY25779.1 minimal PKS chain-length factor (CLF/KS beta) [Pseudosporangium ferrugineum]BCJ56171.1 actinorhodin polyketide beta-ketoacyl synthase [Actinoplanes sp. NBRC 14428]